MQRTFLVSAVLACALLAAAWSPGRAAEANGDDLKLSYGIYVAGTRVFKISYSAFLTPEGYKTTVAMTPKGVGKAFADFRLKMATAGLISGGMPQPVDFNMESSKDDEHKKVAMTWSSDDPPKVDRSFKMPKDRAAEVDRLLDAQTPDPLTAVLRHALDAETKPCTGSLRSYNGAEVYDLAFKLIGQENIEIKGGVYTGPAFRCKVVFIPIAGFAKKKMRKHLADPPTYTIWFAEITSPATANKYLLPVQGVGRVAGRTFQIVASDAQMSGRSFTALSQLGD